jgi:lysophospholipase
MQNHHDVIKEKLSDEYKKVLILNTGGTISMFPSP